MAQTDAIIHPTNVEFWNIIYFHNCKDTKNDLDIKGFWIIFQRIDIALIDSVVYQRCQSSLFCEYEAREVMENSQNDFRDKTLDPEFLSTPFKVQTNWHVIAGVSCSGKTTLFNQLVGEVFKTVQEVAREYIGNGLRIIIPELM